jgi:hypothetical protein
MAHALTTVRLLLIVLFAFLMAHDESHRAALAAGVLTLATATDVLELTVILCGTRVGKTQR